MSLFVCDRCGCIEELELVLAATVVTPGATMLCSECLPVGKAQNGFKAGTGQWHGLFAKRQYDPAMDLPVNRPTGLSFAE